MNFNNETKKPMIIFGVNIDKFCKDIQLLGKLPEFCDNLLIKPEDRLICRYNESKFENSEEVKAGNTDNSDKNKKRLKKEEISKLIERLTKIDPEKKFKKLKKIRILQPVKLNDDTFNLSDRLPSSCSVLKKMENEAFSDNKKKKKRRIDFNIFNIFGTNKKNCETSSINNLIKSRIIDNQNLSTQNKNRIEYIKKWNLPKIIKFDKISGREKAKPKNPLKFKSLELARQNYSPNFNYIYPYSYRYVNFSPNNKNFHSTKLSLTRKIMYNFEMMRNSSSENLYILDAINDEKKKKKELKLKKLKEKYGKLFEFLSYDINKHKLRLSILNKNIKDF